MRKTIEGNLSFKHVIVKEDSQNRYLKHCGVHVNCMNGDVEELAGMVLFTAYDYGSAQKHRIPFRWHCLRSDSYLHSLWDVVCSSYSQRAQLPINVRETIDDYYNETGICIIINDLMIGDGYYSRQNDQTILRQFAQRMGWMFDFVTVKNPQKVTPGVRNEPVSNPDSTSLPHFWSVCGFFMLEPHIALHWRDLCTTHRDDIDWNECFSRDEIAFNYSPSGLNNVI